MALKEVFGNPRYRRIGVLAFLFFALVSAFTMNIVSAFGVFIDHTMVLAPDIQWHGVLYWLVFSGLAALTVSLTAYRYEKLKRAGMVESLGGMVGLAVGSVATTCPVCAPLLLVLLGVPLSLASLPLQGWEFRTGGLVLLALSALAIARNLDQEACNVPKEKPGK